MTDILWTIVGIWGWLNVAGYLFVCGQGYVALKAASKNNVSFLYLTALLVSCLSSGLMCYQHSIYMAFEFTRLPLSSNYGFFLAHTGALFSFAVWHHYFISGEARRN